MCILFVYLNKTYTEGSYRLILACNRDEFWQRPTDTVDFRDNGCWLGGVDLVPGREGGTWLGISTTGKVAVLLNILSPHKSGAKGRGSLVREYLTQDVCSERYQHMVSATSTLYNPFHLLLFDLRNDHNVQCVTYCDKAQTKSLPPGYFGADNSKHIEKPWKKRKEGEVIFSRIIEEYGSTSKKDQLVQSIMDFLNDRTRYFPDKEIKEQYAETGESDVELIQSTSAIFVFSPKWRFGTRTNTVILVDKDGNCDYFERTLQTPVDTTNLQWQTKQIQFKLNL